MCFFVKFCLDDDGADDEGESGEYGEIYLPEERGMEVGEEVFGHSGFGGDSVGPRKDARKDGDA